MKKVLSIVGPTGVGKTALSFYLSDKISSIILSADSIQVYKGLDIISGKDLPGNARFVEVSEIISNKDFTVGYYDFNKSPIFLLDIASPIYNFNVSDFATLGNSILNYIHKKGKLPMVVGGTGFYVQSLFENIKTINIAPDKELRGKLGQKEIPELQNILEKINKKHFDLMNNSDRNNPQRLVRAIEIFQLPLRDSHVSVLNNKYDVLTVGLECARETLKKRIDRRVRSRLEQGALNEAKLLSNSYERLSPSIKTANGYRQLFEYLMDKMVLERAIEKWKISEYRHAKNQMTYFKKYMNVIWFDIEKTGFEKKVAECVLSWYNK